MLIAMMAVAGLLSVNPALGDERTLRVVVTEAGLTIDAHDTPVADVVEAIGKRAGFTVVELAPTRRPISIALRDTSVDEALRMVLRADSYLVQYRSDAQVEPIIDKIVLLGPITDGPAPPARDRVAVPVIGSTGSGGVRVDDLLRAQASLVIPDFSPVVEQTPPAARERPGAVTAGTQSAGGPSATTQSVDEALTVLVQRARQDLKVLLEGLSVATESFLPSPSR